MTHKSFITLQKGLVVQFSPNLIEFNWKQNPLIVAYMKDVPDFVC